MAEMSGIREHMEVIGADGVYIGTVDKVEGQRIKLTRKDSGEGDERSPAHDHSFRGSLCHTHGPRAVRGPMRSVVPPLRPFQSPPSMSTSGAPAPGGKQPTPSSPVHGGRNRNERAIKISKVKVEGWWRRLNYALTSGEAITQLEG
jgi:hypothetical protein